MIRIVSYSRFNCQLLSWVSYIHLGSQSLSNLILTSARPIDITAHIHRIQRHVVKLLDEVTSSWGGFANDYVAVCFDLITEILQWQIVNSFSEWILNLCSDGTKSEDDIRSKNGGRNGHPFEFHHNLEG